MIFYNRFFSQYWWVFHHNFFNTYIFATHRHSPLIFQTMNFVRSNSRMFEKIWVCGKNSFPLIDFSKKFYLGWKGHVLIYHVEEFLKRTGIYTEQCSEAVHANFKKTYKRYACNEAFEGHGEKLRKAVSSYSSMRI